jgi:hypothetical protein
MEWELASRGDALNADDRTSRLTWKVRWNLWDRIEK